MNHTYEVKQGLLTEAETKYLLALVEDYSGPDPKPGFEGTGIMTEDSIKDGQYPVDFDPDKVLFKVINIVKDYFLSNYKMMGELTFNRIFGVTMHEGAELPAHRDEDANNDGIFDGKKRSHVCSIILNDDFEGGDLVFPDFNESVNPPSGSIVFFPGYYVTHGVSKITKGSRKVLLVFFYDVIG